MLNNDVFDRMRRALAEYGPLEIEHPSATAAAVLILAHEMNGDVHLLFTQRTDQVEHHKGQISFPGGACDHADDCLETTALRETFEEIGVNPKDVEIIGRLDDLVTISNFRVTPFVGILNGIPSYSFTLNNHEVEHVVHAPLNHLLDERNMELELRDHQGKTVLVPAFSYNGHRIWGATARILHQFLEPLR